MKSSTSRQRRLKIPVISIGANATGTSAIDDPWVKTHAVEIVKKTNKIYDVESAAVQTLKDDKASLLARRVGAFIAKEVAANEISRRDKTLGALAWLVMHASERADLRQWSTLPDSIQVVRFYLQPGVYDI